MRILLLVALTSATLNAFSQLDLSRQITLEVNDVSLEKLFEILETNHEILIAFGIDNVPDIKFSISVRNKTIFDVLQIVCSKTGLTYQIIDTAIVFKYARQATAPSIVKGMDSIASPNLPIELPTLAVSAPAMIGDSLISTPVDTLTGVADNSQSNTESTQSEPLINFQSDPAQAPSLFSSEKKSRNKIYGAGMFFSYAMDYNQFHFVERDITFQKYKVDWNHSASLGGYIIVSSKLYISLGVGYATKDFALDYNYEVLDPDDPFPIPDQTKVKIRYLEIPLTVGYGVLSRRKFSLCIAAGFYPSYLIEENEHTTYLNSGDLSTSYFVSATRSILYSGTIGFIAHYSISKSVGVFLEPGYLYFIGPVNNKAMEANSSLLRIKTGIQFSLFHKK